MFLSLGKREMFILSKVSKIEFLVMNFLHVNSKSEGGSTVLIMSENSEFVHFRT